MNSLIFTHKKAFWKVPYVRELFLDLTAKDRYETLCNFSIFGLLYTINDILNADLLREIRGFGFYRFADTHVEILEIFLPGALVYKLWIEDTDEIITFQNGDINMLFFFLHLYGRFFKSMTVLAQSFDEKVSVISREIRKSCFIGNKCLNKNPNFLEKVLWDEIDTSEGLSKFKLFKYVENLRFHTLFL